MAIRPGRLLAAVPVGTLQPQVHWIATDEKGSVVAEVEITNEGGEDYTARYGYRTGDEIALHTRTFQIKEGNDVNIMGQMMWTLIQLGEYKETM